MIVILFAALSNAAGQSSLPEGAIRILEAEAERGGADMEELVAYCEMLLAHPLDLNSASEEELSAFPLLTQFAGIQGEFRGNTLRRGARPGRWVQPAKGGVPPTLYMTGGRAEARSGW